MNPLHGPDNLTTRIAQVTLISIWLLIAVVLLFQDTGQAGSAPKEQAAPTPGGFHFVAVGDTGSGVSFQRDITKQLTTLQKKTGYQLLIHLGDIIYPSGGWDKSGDRLYKNMYAPLTDNGVEIRPVLGNHDVRYGYRTGTTEYYEMPGRYYQFSVKNVDFFAVDTNIMNDHAQREWLDQALSKSTAPWKIVYGHHPIYSSGVHRTNRALLKRLEPLLVKHRVDFYLAGHDHNYERFNTIQGVTYIVSGGGGAYLRNFRGPEKNSLVRLKTHHFLHFNVHGEHIEYQAIDKTGRVIDSASYTKNPSTPAPVPQRQPSGNAT